MDILRLTTEIKLLIDSEKIDDLLQFLNDNNYYLEIVIDSLMWLNEDILDDTTEDETMLGFIYNSSIYTSYSDFRTAYRANQGFVPRMYLLEDLQKISRKLIHYYRMGLFRSLEQTLYTYIAESKYFYENIAFGGLTADISFRVKGIEVFLINGQHATEEEIEEIGFDSEYFLSQIGNYDERLNITHNPSFKALNPDSRVLLNAGQQILNLVLNDNKIDLIDYSPLLLNFIKAIECETKALYLKYFKEIYSMSLTLDKYLKSETKDEKYLKQQLTFIKNKKIGYNPSGMRFLYCLLKYFALRKEISTGIFTDGFLPLTDYKIITDNLNLIERINSYGESRNKYVHEKIVSSKEEFYMHYYDLTTILLLMAHISSLKG